MVARPGLAAIMGAWLLGTPTPASRTPPIQRPPAGAVTAFVDVSVIPMDTERVLAHQTVVVREGRIAALGPVAQVQVPANAVRIDGRGQYLIPGLADMHFHLAGDSATNERALVLLAANGVTTIRNVNAFARARSLADAYPDQVRDNAFLLRLRARAAAGQIMSPRIYTSGPWGPGQYIGYRLTGDPPPQLDSVAAYITAYKAAGYDFVKIHSEDSVVAQLVAAAAHRAGIPIIGHIGPLSDNPAVAMQQAVQLGYTSIEHYDHVALDTGILTAVRQAGVWVDPTLAYNMSDVNVSLGTELQYVPPTRLAEWETGHAPATAGGRPGQPHGWLDSVGHGTCQRDPCRVVRALHKAGVGLLSGTDVSDNLWMFGVPGFSLHRELAALVFAGLTPYAALATSTRNAAASLGTIQESGTIAVGKRADLVLLAENPLQDILATTRITGVMLGGRWLSRSVLDRRLAVERTAVATADYGRPFDYGPQTRRPRRQP